MPSNTQRGADNQQERQIGWIVGFVDGEGTFSVSLIKNPTTASGWQVFPEFVITQGARSFYALEAIRGFFGCGKIYCNRRFDNHREDLYRYCVRSIKDLETVIVPFFREHPLQTAKQKDFEIFQKILGLMKQGTHRANSGLRKIAGLIETMNRRKPARYLASSETIRRAPQGTAKI